MKAFWAGILVLALAAGGLLFARGGAPNVPTPVEQTGLTERTPDRGRPETPVVEPSDADSPETEVADAEPATTEPAVTEPAVTEPVVTDPAETEVADADPAATDPAETASSGTELAEASGGDVADPGVSDPGAPDSMDVAADAVEGFAPVEVEVPEGAMLLNDRHVVTGDGTEEAPYVVSWDALLALEQFYAPKKEGKTEIPDWVKVLDGKHVAITGFIAFPFIAPTADECMVMLNEWDGCCIGVPPTPYDAVEVKLAETLNLNDGMVNYGTLTGVFRTDPYLVNGWLIGLYVMDDATISSGTGVNKVGF